MRQAGIDSVKRIVIKIGRQTIIKENRHVDFRKLEALAAVIAQLMAAGKQILIVTSGAVDLGAHRLGLAASADNIPAQQTLAAIGQGLLIGHYQRFFSYHGLSVGQVLLDDDLSNRPASLTLARQTVETLLANGMVPIISENQSLSVNELSAGQEQPDHDLFAAKVSQWFKADLLIVLSQLAGLYLESPLNRPQAHLIETVHKVTKSVKGMAKSIDADFPQAGFQHKLKAADLLLKNQQAMALISDQDLTQILSLMAGQEIGTLFYKAKKH